jgi:hypothetical protein
VGSEKGGMQRTSSEKGEGDVSVTFGRTANVLVQKKEKWFEGAVSTIQEL